MFLRREVRGLVLGAAGLAWLSLCVLPCTFPLRAEAQSPLPPTVQGGVATLNVGGTGESGVERHQDRKLSGYISGTVVDTAGAVAVGAQVRLGREDQSPTQEVFSGNNGQFSFTDLPPGPFRLTTMAAGFENQEFFGVLRPGEAYIVPEIRLAIAPVVTEVKVVELTQVELAEAQIKEQEKQRVLGLFPNFYVTYVPDAAPLAPKQKFELAWRSTTDPFTFVGVGAIAGVEQAFSDFGGYGQGASGYAKRYGAAYANVFVGTFVGSAILPSLLKQDPRYFYKGTGHAGSRFLYALANVVICKGDNKRWQANYSAILGGLAAGGISNLYYPAKNRDEAELTFENTLIGIGETAAVNLLQEFLIRRLTPNAQHHEQVDP
jgi:hypothetical protein